MELTRGARAAVLVASLLGLVFDGLELGLMPVAALSVSRSLLGDAYTARAGGDWFAWYTAALMLGAAFGGVVLGRLGDRAGRTRAMGVSIVFYSAFAAAGAWVKTPEQMLLLRFGVGLGVGGVWPNAMALVAECWPGASKALVSGVLSAGLNLGILLLSAIARTWPITPDTWRWIFHLAGIPALLGLIVLVALPESPAWLAARGNAKGPSAPVRELFGPSLKGRTLAAIALSSIPMVGAWAASKWMIPWADGVAGPANASYKAVTQSYWAIGAAIGSLTGAQLAGWIGARRSYAWISGGATALTIAMFQLTAPLEAGFHGIVFLQGLVATLFFGWLAVYLPAQFPISARATGSGLAYNAGRFATAGGVLFAGILFGALGGDYPRVGTVCALVYALGLGAAIWVREPERAAPKA